MNPNFGSVCYILVRRSLVLHNALQSWYGTDSVNFFSC